MSEENLEEWDAAFLEQVEQVIQAKERSLSSSTANISYLPTQPPNPLNNAFISYSPPRELSQRVAAVDQAAHLNSFDPASNDIFANSSASTDNAKDLEILRLTRELGRVSKQLSELEHECSELKKEKTEKELLKLASAKNDEKVANNHNSKCKNLNYEVLAVDHHGVPRQFQNEKDPDVQVGPRINTASSSCKAIGVQVDLTSHLELPEKLRAIWGSRRDQKLGKSLISKLLVDCAVEFHVLFGCTGRNTSSRMMDSLAVESSDLALQLHSQSYPSSEAAKISPLFSMLMKISNGMTPPEALLEPLLDLCCVDNVTVVNKSLRILHMFLKQLLSLERKVEERDNVTVEGIISRSNIGDLRGPYTAKDSPFCFSGNEASSVGCIPSGIRFSGAETVCKKGLWSPDKITSGSCINWVSVFELMHQTTMKVTDECVRSEAISIMNMIVMSSYAYIDREKFGQNLVFESISQVLKREAGLRVQREAVRLLYLLLNCPKIFATFCSGCKKEENAGAAEEIHANPLPSKGFCMILEGLTECIRSHGNSVQDLELRRNAIIVIAFIVSSGGSGVEIISSQKLCGEANFLMLLLQELVSEIDFEAAACTVPADVFRARTLLIREILILLNRLVSNPAYSSVVLRVLTNSRDIASLTIDVATRLSRKVGTCDQSDTISRQMRESEVVDLGQIFRKRVFTYLGDNIS
ncbi:putative Dimerizations [Melia azedarach]|uniref:Dimerizations n=1 Tax=Melia azedarach TaxID=155640 RepID=A0ACC1YYG5_MELAZ|nr:putative Dimerizations [Melia azedarach]